MKKYLHIMAMGLVVLLIIGGLIIQRNKSPQAGVVLTFDDHSIEDWLNVQPLFEQYDAKATFFVNYIDDLSPEELKGVQQLYQMGNEIGCHTLNHLKATDYIKTHTIEEYIQADVIPSIEKLKELGITPKSFSYPYGARNKDLDHALLNYFDVLRGTAYLTQPVKKEEINKIYYTMEQPNRVIYGLGIDESYGYSDEDILKVLQRAKDTNSIVVLYGHTITKEGDPKDKGTYRKRLEKILQFVNDHHMTYYTASEIANVK